MVDSSRSLARQAITLIDDPGTSADVVDAQGGLERIKNTPLPVHYRVLPALCRTIQIDLSQALGQPAPPTVEPVDEVLW